MVRDVMQLSPTADLTQGIHAVVAGACLYVLLSASGKKQWPLIAFVAVLFAVSSVLTGTNTKWHVDLGAI